MNFLRRRWFPLSAALLLAQGGQAFEAAPLPIAAQGTLQAAFAPWDDIESMIAEAIGGAKRQILVQAYLLTSKTITANLIADTGAGSMCRC